MLTRDLDRDVARVRDRDFSRDGALSPELLVTLLLFMVGDGRRRGYRHLLDAFWDQASLAGISLPLESPVSAPAFCQARAKLSAGFVRTLVHEVNRRFDAAFEADARFKERRVLAVDGSALNLQRSDELVREFGRQKDAYCPQTHITTLFNVVSMVPVDVANGRRRESERDLLIDEHISHLAKGDVVVLDRGYFGFDVFEQILETGADFVARIPVTGTFKAVTQFAASDEQERIIEIRASRRSKSTSGDPIRLRAVRSKREGDEDFVFVTSLQKASGFSRKDIENLYRLRWQVEEHYKTFKSEYMGQGNLHSRTAAGVRQEIAAITLFHALTRYFLAAAAKHVSAPYGELSTKSGCLGLADYVVRLFVPDTSPASEWLHQLLTRIARTRDKKRPGRSCPRRSFRPRRRWGPNGRVNA